MHSGDLPQPHRAAGRKLDHRTDRRGIHSLVYLRSGHQRRFLLPGQAPHASVVDMQSGGRPGRVAQAHCAKLAAREMEGVADQRQIAVDGRICGPVTDAPLDERRDVQLNTESNLQSIFLAC